MVQLFTKKPVTIEALLWENDLSALKTWMDALGSLPMRLNSNNDLVIDTLEGVMLVNRGDYIIKGIKGEFYPCKPDIFQMTYEAAK